MHYFDNYLHYLLAYDIFLRLKSRTTVSQDVQTRFPVQLPFRLFFFVCLLVPGCGEKIFPEKIFAPSSFSFILLNPFLLINR